MPLYPQPSSSGLTVLNSVAAGTTLTIPDNTQMPFTGQIVVVSTGILLTEGSGALTWVN